MTKVLFVCLGNICRSPTAHGVFEKMLEAEGMADSVAVDSCGTGSWHIGQEPDERTQQAAQSKGYDLGHLRARRLRETDFDEFDYILAMDTRNLADVMKRMPSDYQGQVKLFMDYSHHQDILEVPDPYYGGGDGFDHVLSLVESACKGLIEEIKKQDA